MDDKQFAKYKSHSESGPGDGGKTGTWRVERPVIKYEVCIPAKTGKMACLNCWLLCPDGVVTRTLKPEIDYEYCKGCGICAEECPAGAIEMIEETSFIDKEK